MDLTMSVLPQEATSRALLEGAKAAVGDISAKVSRVADASGKSISDRANLGKL
jgi:hypothetical protein